MSLYSIKQYQTEVEKIIHFGGTKKETAIRNAFYNLLNEYAKGKGLMLVPEVAVKSTLSGKSVIPDGTLKDTLRQDWGYWESKDESDILDDEIKKKFAKGYPKDNILFEDSQTAVLIQNGVEVNRVVTKDAEALHGLITDFINFERPEISNFRKAIELFKQDIPKVTEALRDIIITAEKTNPKYVKASAKFLKLCHDSINPEVTPDDVREMIIQHILTEDVFNTIFDETQFHRENNIAHELEQVIHTFFTGSTRKTTLAGIQHYYQAINAAGAGIADHHEKQKFLKIIYETFYKSYNPKAADRLGVVYTPNEIVQFMIKGTDYLLHKHFNKFLEDKGVEILDPATGTGTFICDIIDYIRKEKLEYKYRNEMHANEVAILPYYISNLNIEFTYTQKMGKYAEFENLCFVDTLDNMGFAYRGKQIDMFAPFTEENSKRIKKQNDRKIAVVIGNPPYNANQQNFNDNNSNREYIEIDRRIKDTYIKKSTATNKANLYDMYTRFYRWAMDRIDNRGIISFITNNSFINSRAFDGFRQCIAEEFQYIYVVDLGGNIRELSGKDGIFLNENHTIFGQAAAVGIAMMFLVKDSTAKKERSEIYYIHPTDIRATRDEKLAYLAENAFKDIAFEIVRPDKKNNWINLTDNDFDSLLPVIDKAVKAGKSKRALFESYSLGVDTHRDEWVYDLSEENLKLKIDHIIKVYAGTMADKNFINQNTIAWSRELKKYLARNIEIAFNKDRITNALYRPFTKQKFYFDKHLNSYLFSFNSYISKTIQNKILCVKKEGNDKPFHVLGTNTIADLHTTGDTQCLPFYTFDIAGNQKDNITDWGLNQFTKQYGTKKITKEDIFNYTYAVLHNPAYRTKYELNLKREFPRIPFYTDFKKWAAWGKALMDIHINYESVEPYKLKEVTTDTKETPKAKLKADKEKGNIIIDENTTLTGVPPQAWLYKLGNRSALEWVLDQYKESKPKDPTIAEKFNTYRFADYKTQVIDLLKRVCTVSVNTMDIINQMNAEAE